jgi:hypothetical protein
LGPVGLSLVLREELGEFPQRPVGCNPGGRLRWNGCPSEPAVLLGRQWKDQGEYAEREQYGPHQRLRYHSRSAV